MKQLLQLFIVSIIVVFTMISCEKEEPQQPTTFPDLQPEILCNWNTLNTFEVFTIRLHNTGSITTLSSIFYVQKMDPVANIFPTFNPNVGIIEQATRWKVTINSFILPGSFKDINFIIEPTLAGSGSITATVVSGTGGGETPTTNNIDVHHFKVE